MNAPFWPDSLQKPDPNQVQHSLVNFWQTLASLADLVRRHEHLLAEEQLSALRKIVLAMMLALNGVKRPVGTIHLNSYLGESQRQMLEKTLLTPSVSRESWIGAAVALVVIYRWYAPQLVEKFGLDYPQAVEEETLEQLKQQLPEWPLKIETE